MKKLKCGFTISEMLVAIGLVGFISMILFLTIKEVQPNQEKLMLKKSFYTAQRLIREIANDEELYPEPTDRTNGDWYLANTEAILDPLTGEVVSGEGKFCNLFRARMNIKSVGAGICAFTTTDGVYWVLPATGFKNDPPAEGEEDVIDESVVYISIDVNGEKAPGCYYNADMCKKPDQFVMRIYPNGRLVPSSMIVLDGSEEKQEEFDAQVQFFRSYLEDANVTNEAKRN